MHKPNTHGSKLKKRLTDTFSASGGLHLTKWLTKNSPKILMYHRFGPDDGGSRMGISTFEQQIRLLKQSFEVIPMSKLGSMLENGQTIPANIAVITIDDGYDDFYNYAFPILQRYSVPATLYVTTGFVDREVWLWPDVITYIIANTQRRRWSIEINNKEQYFNFSDDVVETRRTWVDIAQYCLTLDESQKTFFLKEFAEELAVFVPVEPTKHYSAVTWDQLRKMEHAGIEIAGHTRTHPRLVKVEKNNLADEILGCKHRIEEMIDRSVLSFAYPNGEKQDYDEDVKKLVRKAGYTTATVSFYNQKKDDRYELGRYPIDSDLSDFRNVLWGARQVSLQMREYQSRLFY